MRDQIIIEVVKLLANLSGTALIAWFAVRWALKSFKHEKTWEQRLSAYSRALTALGDMQAVMHHWLSDIEMRVDRSDEYEDRMSERYRAAMIELQQCISLSRLILPDETFQTLNDLHQALGRIGSQDRYGDLDKKASLVGGALTKVSEQGRSALR